MNSSANLWWHKLTYELRQCEQKRETKEGAVFVEKNELYVIIFVDAAEKTAPEKFSTNAEI